MSSSNVKPGEAQGASRLVKQLSRTLTLGPAAAGAAALDPSLRAALAHPPHQRQQGAAGPVSFAARAALDPDNPQASLDMFRRLSSSRRER